MTHCIKGLWKVCVNDVTLNLFFQTLVCNGQQWSKICFAWPSRYKTVLIITQNRENVIQNVFCNNLFKTLDKEGRIRSEKGRKCWTEVWEPPLWSRFPDRRKNANIQGFLKNTSDRTTNMTKWSGTVLKNFIIANIVTTRTFMGWVLLRSCSTRFLLTTKDNNAPTGYAGRSGKASMLSSLLKTGALHATSESNLG